MQHVETIAINRPVGVVWELTGNPANWQRWEPGVTDVQLDGDLAQGAGITYKWRGKQQTGTVTRYIRNQEIAIRVEQQNYTFLEAITMRGIGSMTNVTMSMGFAPKVWWATALSPLLFLVKKLAMGMPMRKSLKALQREAEKAQAPVAA